MGYITTHVLVAWDGLEFPMWGVPSKAWDSLTYLK